MTPSIPRVAIVGAGFAGCIAAADLASAGLDVLVLEARSRAGGRVWSHTTHDGLVVEMGAELVEDWYATMRDLVALFGLSLIPGPERFLRFPFFGGADVVANGPQGIVEPVYDALRRLDELGHSMSPERLDELTVRSGLDRVGLKGIARRWFDVLISGWSCRETHEESLLAFLEMRARPVLEDGLAHERWARRVVGGNDQIAKRLIEPLGDRVLFNRPVRRITWGQATHGVQVDVDADAGVQSFGVEAVVLAIPFQTLARIEFRPLLPPAVQAVIAQVKPGLGAKAAIRYSGDHPAPDLFLSESPRFHAWRSGDALEAQSITLYMGGDATTSLAGLPAERWNAEALRRLAVSHPHISAAATEVNVAVWSSDPFTSSCGPVYLPGTFHARERWLGEPIGAQLYFAGEHTSSDAFGSMEGALRTGRRAASEIVADQGS